MRKLLIKIILIMFLFSPVVSSALELDYPEFGPEGKEITISLEMDLNLLIAWLYYFIVGIAGVSTFLMLVWGGFSWLTSVGDPSKIKEAKDRVYSAFLGLIIILASFLILNVINPDLTTLRLPGLE